MESRGDVVREDDGAALERRAIIPGGGGGVGGKRWLPRHSAPAAPGRWVAMAQHVVV